LKELELVELILTHREKQIESMKFEVREFKIALNIPRYHYKHIENARFEEIMKQRDQIIIEQK
jgi:hypothetical protein